MRKAIIGTVLFSLFFFIFTQFNGTFDVESINITVTEKVVKNGRQSSTYMVFTAGGEVFRCEDSLLDWRFDASDRYGAMRAGGTYRVLVRGVRRTWTSQYRNIVSVGE